MILNEKFLLINQCIDEMNEKFTFSELFRKLNSISEIKEYQIKKILDGLIESNRLEFNGCFFTKRKAECIET